MPSIWELNEQQVSTANCRLCFEGSRQMNKRFFFSAKIQRVCRMYLAKFFFHSKQTTKTVNKERWTTGGRINWRHSTVRFTKHPIHFRRPQEIHSPVYTVYMVRKELGSLIVQPLLLKLTLGWTFHGNVGITVVATLMEGQNLKVHGFCVYTGVFLLCL